MARNSTAISVRSLTCGVLVTWGVCLVAGCQTLPSEKYSFDNLPAVYLAARKENPHTLELSRLARYTPKSDIIDRGDVVNVTIAAGLDSKETVFFPVRVQENGQGHLPVIGSLTLAGLGMEEAEATIIATCIQRELYRNPTVTVQMGKQPTNRVMVVGAVKQPGTYELPRGKSDLLTALVSAGSLAEDAGTVVEIKNPQRGAQPAEPDRIASTEMPDSNAEGHSSIAPAGMSGNIGTVRIDLITATKTGSAGVALEDGSVVYVEKRDPEPVFVQGLVRKPDRYEYPVAEELRLLGALSLAGGVSNAMANRVFVIRRKPNTAETIIVDLKISEAKRSEQANLLLAPGDVVSVEQTPATVLLDAFRTLNLGVGASLPLTVF